MSYIIVTRNPRNNRIVVISDGDDNDPDPAVFKTYSEAISAADRVPVIVAGWPYTIVETP